MNYARACKDKYDESESFKDSEDNGDKLAAVDGKNVAVVDRDEIEDNRKIPAIPAYVGIKPSTSPRGKVAELSMKAPSTRKKAKV